MARKVQYSPQPKLGVESAALTRAFDEVAKLPKSNAVYYIRLTDPKLIEQDMKRYERPKRGELPINNKG